MKNLANALTLAVLTFGIACAAAAESENGISYTSTGSSELIPAHPFQVEVSYVYMPLQPQVFASQELNKKHYNHLNMQGASLGLGKSFHLFSDFSTVTNARFIYAQDIGKLDGYSVARTTSMMNGQLSQQIAFKIPGFKLDGAHLQPFVGGGGYWSSFSDRYTDPSKVNSSLAIQDYGGLFETGIMWVHPVTGFFSSIKAIALQSVSTGSSTTTQANKPYAASTAPALDASMPVMYSLGLGAMF